jgi:DNA-binding GntR family transcriptional regulator
MSTFDNQQAAADGVIMPIERSTYKNHVIKYIYDGMRENRYRAGEKILESHLSRELGISRAPIREALAELVSSGLLESRPQIGNFVASLTAKVSPKGISSISSRWRTRWKSMPGKTSARH